MLYPNIDPVAMHIGSWGIRWYGIAYLLGFIWVFFMGKYAIKFKKISWINNELYENILVNTMLAVLIGGRLGYILFYQFSLFVRDPWVLFKIWQGGMSFHGALIGGLVFLIYYTNKFKIVLLRVTDLIVPWVPLGLGFGRLANFINGELWGRPTNDDWGMVFPWVDEKLRHPSQLYEFFLEGVVLSLIMYVIFRKVDKLGFNTGAFLLLYGVFRFGVEFFRAPDQQIGLLFGASFTMGQLLSVPMIVVGMVLILRLARSL